MKQSYQLGVGAALALTVCLGGSHAWADGKAKGPKGNAPGATQSAAPSLPSKLTDVNPIAAEVNGEKIMSADLNRMLESYRQTHPVLAGDSPEAEKSLEEIRGRILDDMINVRLVSQEAQRLNLTPTNTEVDAEFQKIKSQFPNEQAFNDALKKEGISQDYIRQDLPKHMAFDSLMKQWVADITVPDDEIKKFYNDNLKGFQLPESVRARHILLAVKPDAKPAEKAKIRAKAESLLKQAQQGADFGKLATANTDDPGSKTSGGELGFFFHEQMVKPFADAAFSTPPGKVTDHVVESEFGFHIIKVEEKQPAHAAPFDSVHDWIKNRLTNEKQMARYTERLAALKTAAKIKKNI